MYYIFDVNPVANCDRDWQAGLAGVALPPGVESGAVVLVDDGDRVILIDLLLREWVDITGASCSWPRWEMIPVVLIVEDEDEVDLILDEEEEDDEEAWD